MTSDLCWTKEKPIKAGFYGAVMNNPDVKFVHVFALYPMNGDTLRRHELARASWEAEYARTGKWVFAGLHVDHAQRTSKDVGDSRGVHYVKDLVNHAAVFCHDNDIIVLTNTDSCFVEGITDRLIRSRAGVWPGYSHRRDFTKLDRILTMAEASRGKMYPGNDLFAFTRRWWAAHRDEMPDALISYAGWDACLRLLCNDYGGRDIGCTVVHELHPAFWMLRQNRQTHPGQLWNAKVNRPFLLKHGWTQAECERYA